MLEFNIESILCLHYHTTHTYQITISQIHALDAILLLFSEHEAFRRSLSVTAIL
jgi:hypothetical protein